MKFITYGLFDESNSPDNFYKVLEVFTDRFLNTIIKNSRGIIDEFMDFQRKNQKNLRSLEEYLLDLIFLGIAWNNYVNYAVNFDVSHKEIFKGLIKARRQGGVLKIVADGVRGVLSTIFLNKRTSRGVKVSLGNLSRLLEWLSATGEFTYEVKRLYEWENFLGSKEEETAVATINKFIKIAKQFDQESSTALGVYTANVEVFLKNHKKSYNLREDYIFCGRRRNEYHLNMFGAELLNRTYKKEFLETSEKLLLLPACMRIVQRADCKAVKTSRGLSCAKCSLNCEVAKLTSYGEKYNFKVLIIPHESDAFSSSVNKSSTGIIGVACVLNLIEGGLKAIELGYVPQCVFLDYCGCSNHWDNEGIATSISINKLMETLKI